MSRVTLAVFTLGLGLAAAPARAQYAPLVRLDLEVATTYSAVDPARREVYSLGVDDQCRPRDPHRHSHAPADESQRGSG